MAGLVACGKGGKASREEEDVVFPRLHEKLTDEENRKLTARMNFEGFKVA